MGGDDLGSDDEYLNDLIVDDSFQKVDSLSDKLNDNNIVEEAPISSKKRKRKTKTNGSPSLTDNNDATVVEVPSKKSSSRVLLEAGRNLENQSADVQATFLWTALKHNLQLKGESIEKIPRLKSSHFYASKEPTLLARLKSSISMKKMKKWKPIGSPQVVVVCVSARRAVAVLKELSGLKVRAAKLFAKHMDLSQQKELLAQNAYGLAVGTPNRLRALAGENSLTFEHTQLVLLDSEANPKGYTVCTLPDTAPDCMQLLSGDIIPQLTRRKDIKIAMF